MNGDFGSFLESVQERDVDLLLMEEFHVSPSFVSWFCSAIGLVDVKIDGAWHSVADTDGESDLILRVICGTRRFGILIENKITAPEQDRQAERYHIRGIANREAGKFDEYMAVICAPNRYLEALSADSEYHHRIGYESIAEWFGNINDARAQWRQHIMHEAIEQGRRGYTMLVNQPNTQFHFDYWQHIQKHHPKLYMKRPTSKGSRSNWIIMRGHDFPANVKLHHKLDQDTVELGFQGKIAQEILDAQSTFPDDIRLTQKGSTASLCIRVPAVDMKAGVQSQVGQIDACLEAAYRLMSYSTLLQP